MVDLLDNEDLIAEYAEACNVDVEDMDRCIRKDPLGREQYLAWATQRQEDFDPTPWCSHCRSMTSKGCKCGPLADNE